MIVIDVPQTYTSDQLAALEAAAVASYQSSNPQKCYLVVQNNCNHDVPYQILAYADQSEQTSGVLPSNEVTSVDITEYALINSPYEVSILRGNSNIAVTQTVVSSLNGQATVNYQTDVVDGVNIIKDNMLFNNDTICIALLIVDHV